MSALVLTAAPTLATLGGSAGVGIATEWRWWSRGSEATTMAAIAALLLQPASVSETTYTSEISGGRRSRQQKEGPSLGEGGYI